MVGILETLGIQKSEIIARIRAREGFREIVSVGDSDDDAIAAGVLGFRHLDVRKLPQEVKLSHVLASISKANQENKGERRYEGPKWFAATRPVPNTSGLRTAAPRAAAENHSRN